MAEPPPPVALPTDAAIRQVNAAIDAVRLVAGSTPAAHIALSPLIRAREALSGGQELDWSDAADLETKQIEMPKVIIEDLFRRGEVILIAAESKLGKTWNAITMSIEVATGGAWLGQSVLLKGPVLYVNMELARAVCELRTKLLCNALGKSPMGVHFVHLRGMSTDLESLIPALVAKAKEVGAVLIVLDALYNLLGDRDENSNGDMAGLMADLTRLATETECAVCAVHHFNKHSHKGDDGTAGATKMSGAGALHRSPEGVITITRVSAKGLKELGLEGRTVVRVESSLRTLRESPPILVEKASGTNGIPVFNRLDVAPRTISPSGKGRKV